MPLPAVHLRAVQGSVKTEKPIALFADSLRGTAVPAQIAPFGASQ